MKTFLITLFLAFSISNIYAQDSTNVKNKTFNFGSRVGYNAYTINTSERMPYANGYYGGLFFEKRLSYKWALQLETNFNYSGSSTLQLPLLLKYRITEKFEIYGGPQLEYSFEQKTINKELRNKRLGASLVLGTQYNINSNWFVEVRYIYGLTNQFPIFQGFENASVYGKRHSFNLGLGYKF